MVADAVAIVLSYGRASLSELLACHRQQTRSVPLLLWIDGAPALRVARYDDVTTVHSEAIGSRYSLGPVRRAAVEHARALFDLGPESAIIVLDDDDYYHPLHYERTLNALDQGGGRWTGAYRFGLDAGRPGDPVLIAPHTGPSQHATWAFRLGLYDEAGGYRDEMPEDMTLGGRMGLANFRPHYQCTHVRSQRGRNLSCDGGMNRARLREMGGTVTAAAATITPRWERLTEWCDFRLTPRPAVV